MFIFSEEIEKEKSNEIKVWAKCHSCNRTRVQTSYDAKQVKAFYGLLPVNKGESIHVSKKCGYCRESLLYDLNTWKVDFKYQLELHKDLYLQNRYDLKYSLKIIDLLIKFDAKEEFENVVLELSNDFLEVQEFWEKLGDLYRFFMVPDKAFDCYKKSLELSYNEIVRDKLTLLYLEQGEGPTVESDVLEKIKSKSDDSKDLLFLLVEGYRAKGLHKDVLRILDIGKVHIEDIRNDLTFKRLYNESKKNIRNHNVMRCYRLAVDVPYKKGNDIVLILIVTCIVFCVFTGANYFSKPEVYLSGGLIDEYEISISGEKYTVPENYKIKKLNLNYGTHVINSIDKKFPQFSIKMEKPFYLRVLSKETYLINPDSKGKYLEEKVVYSEHANDEAEDSKIHTEQQCYLFFKIDYPFEDFPKTISVPKHKKVYKRRLGFLRYN